MYGEEGLSDSSMHGGHYESWQWYKSNIGEFMCIVKFFINYFATNRILVDVFNYSSMMVKS